MMNFARKSTLWRGKYLQNLGWRLWPTSAQVETFFVFFSIFLIFIQSAEFFFTWANLQGSVRVLSISSTSFVQSVQIEKSYCLAAWRAALSSCFCNFAELLVRIM